MLEINLKANIVCLFFTDYASDFEESSDDDDHQILNRVCKFISLQSE